MIICFQFSLLNMIILLVNVNSYCFSVQEEIDITPLLKFHVCLLIWLESNGFCIAKVQERYYFMIK